MFMRLVEIEIAPDKMDACAAFLRERIAPAVAAQPGFLRGEWGLDRSTGMGMSITFWANAADERASRLAIPDLFEALGSFLATDDIRQQTFEIIHQEQ